MDGKKAWKKTGFGILFVAACFAAMYILMEFHDTVLLVLLAAVLLLVTAFFFLNEIFSDKAKSWALEEEEQAFFQEPASGGKGGEFRLKLTKHMKEMESTQKELIDVLKNQNVLLQSQMENMEQAVFSLSEKQSNQIKSVIKFNKENARQLAISERETLEYIMMELKQAIEDTASAPAPARIASQPAPVAEEPVFAVEELPVPEVPVFEEEPVAEPVEELEEVGQEELFEVSDLPGDDEYVIPEIPAPEEEPAAEGEPEAEDLDLSALFEDMAAGVLEEAAEEPVTGFPAIEDIPVPEEIVPAEEPAEPAPAADPLAGLGGDPNAMMTPEDIAKLLASMGQ